MSEKPARQRKIPPNLHEAVLAESGKGQSHREIAAWLQAEHGVKVSHAAVGSLLRSIADERREAVQAVVADKVARSATRDLEILSELQDDLKAKWDELKNQRGKLALALEVADRLVGLTVKKLKASGVNGAEPPPTVPSADARAELLARMRRLAERAEPAAG